MPEQNTEIFAKLTLTIIHVHTFMH